MSAHHFITVRKATENNLKGISVDVPKNKIVVFTGVSGSGKSSLVFETIYAESQRQLLETWSLFTRARMPKIEKPKFESIEGICSSVVIDQKRLGSNSRSTVGTVSELYGMLRTCYAKAGEPRSEKGANLFSFNKPEGMCIDCKGLGVTLVVDEDELVDWNVSLNKGAIQHPDYKVGGWYWRGIVDSEWFDMDVPLNQFSEELVDKLFYASKVTKKVKATFEGIVTGLKRRRLMREGNSSKKDGKFFKFVECFACKGCRLNSKALEVKVLGMNIAQLSAMELTDLLQFMQNKYFANGILKSVVEKLKARLQVLCEIGVGYLTLSREVATLSGGECQRVKMAKQLSCDLVSMCYVLDEPTVGLHPRDTHKLINVLKELRDRGNSVLVVEHEPTVILGADYIFDLGPHAGTRGGNIVFEGTVEEILETAARDNAGLTAQYLVPRKRVVPKHRKIPTEFIQVRGASVHNLKNISVQVPIGVFVCVTGVAGSGKSTLIRKVFAPQCPRAVIIDQSPVGRSSRSNPATYTGAFDFIRKEFERESGTCASLFSFNSTGACQKCKGLGNVSLEMHFLETVRVTCDECDGLRFSSDVLEVVYHGFNIAEVLDMTIEEVHEFYKNIQSNSNIAQISKRLQVLEDVGLGYLKLGQSVSTLSGGEAQRLKLASELHKSDSVVIMDEPTTGLHMSDIGRLIGIIQRLVDSGNTVIVIEHNLDVALASDWMIDLGPEGGSKGGRVMGEGTPEEISKVEGSFTGAYLKDLL